MNFGQALEVLKNGGRVARNGWNGKDMWLALIPGSTFAVDAHRPLAAHIKPGTIVNYLPHIDMKTVNGDIVPWLASQTDVLADDWVVCTVAP